MLWTGTSGFQYPEWKGSFYPRDLSATKMLSFYAEHFCSTEINYSFYRLPSSKTLADWDAATPDRFRFSFKAPKQITHILRLRNAEKELARFHDVLQTSKDKVGVALFQLPPFLKKDLPLLKEFLDALPPGVRCAFEFRQASWFDDETFAALQKKNAALCIAESAELATPVKFTAKFGYLRLRREDYTKKDIVRWAGVISDQRTQREDVYVYFKHEETGSGPKFAKQLMEAQL